jgi:hypothetical protein
VHNFDEDLAIVDTNNPEPGPSMICKPVTVNTESKRKYNILFGAAVVAFIFDLHGLALPAWPGPACHVNWHR